MKIIKSILLTLLRCIRGFCESMGLCVFLLLLFGEDVNTGNWAMKQMFLNICNMNKFFIGDIKYLFGIVMVIGIFIIGYIMDMCWCNK